MTKLTDKYWSKESRAGKAKNVTSFLAVISIVILFASGVVRNQGSEIVLGYTLDKLLTLFTGLTILSVSVYFQRHYDELTKSQNEPVGDSAHPYVLEIPDLIKCSHNLDKVRNNLRTGIIFIFGIGAALLAWIQNYGSIYGDVQSMLLAGSGVLLLCTIVAILFSFSNPIARLQLENIGEGLVSSEMTESEYQKTLIAIIDEKESHLGRMRGAMQLGLMMFIILGSFGVLSSLVFQMPPLVTDPLIIELLSILNMVSFIVLSFGILIAIGIIFGRTVFGLAD